MEWFRMYHEARKDLKLQTLTDAQFRVWFNLLCLASEQPEAQRGTIPIRSWPVLALEVARGDAELLEATLQQLEQLNIITRTKKHITFLHWQQRQKPSDNSATRVRRHRQKRAVSAKPSGEPLSESPCNVTVTLPKRDRNVSVTACNGDVTAQIRQEERREEFLEEDPSPTGMATASPAASRRPTFKASEPAKELAAYLKTHLQVRGVTSFARDWHLKAAAVAERLLRSGLSPPDLRACIDWALAHPWWGTRVTTMDKVADLVPEWQLTLAQGGARNGEPAAAHRDVAHPRHPRRDAVGGSLNDLCQ